MTFILLIENNTHNYIFYTYILFKYQNRSCGLLDSKLELVDKPYIIGANGVFRFDYKIINLNKINIIKCIPKQIVLIDDMEIKKKLTIVLHELIHYHQCMISYKKNKLIAYARGEKTKQTIKKYTTLERLLYNENQSLLYPIFNNNQRIKKHVKHNYKKKDWKLENEAYTYNDIISFTYIEFYVWFYNMI